MQLMEAEAQQRRNTALKVHVSPMDLPLGTVNMGMNMAQPQKRFLLNDQPNVVMLAQQQPQHQIFTRAGMDVHSAPKLQLQHTTFSTNAFDGPDGTIMRSISVPLEAQGQPPRSGRSSSDRNSNNGDSAAAAQQPGANGDLRSILRSIGVELARHAITIEAAMAAGWLGPSLFPQDVAVLSDSYSLEARRLQQLAVSSDTALPATQPLALPGAAPRLNGIARTAGPANSVNSTNSTPRSIGADLLGLSDPQIITLRGSQRLGANPAPVNFAPMPATSTTANEARSQPHSTFSARGSGGLLGRGSVNAGVCSALECLEGGSEGIVSSLSAFTTGSDAPVSTNVSCWLGWTPSLLPVLHVRIRDWGVVCVRVCACVSTGSGF